MAILLNLTHATGCARCGRLRRASHPLCPGVRITGLVGPGSIDKLAAGIRRIHPALPCLSGCLMGKNPTACTLQGVVRASARSQNPYRLYGQSVSPRFGSAITTSAEISRDRRCPFASSLQASTRGGEPQASDRCAGRSVGPGDRARIPGCRIRAPHLLVVPVVITVIELGEIGMALDKPGLRPRDHPVRLRREDLLLHSWALAKPGIELKSHSGARDTEAVVSALPDRVEPLVEI